MRVVISFILAIFVAFFSGLSVAKSTLSLYAAKSGSVAITTVDSHVSLLALAGGYDNGQSTAGSCVIAANLNRRDSGFTGTLSPINTDINSYTDTQARGKKITIDSGPDDIVIADVDSDGICALNNGLINSYKKLSSGTGQEFSTYLELIELANTDALFLFKEHKLPQAIIRLAPYADNYRVDWLRSGESSKRVVVSALNDYAYFLQENNRMAESIPFLQDIVSSEPLRVVAWLNLADASWALGDKDAAVKQYHEYLRIMNNIKKESKVPARVFERIN